MSTSHETHLEVTSSEHPKVQEVDSQGKVINEKDLSHVLAGLSSTLKSNRTSDAAKVLSTYPRSERGIDDLLKFRNRLRSELMPLRKLSMLDRNLLVVRITIPKSINIECTCFHRCRSNKD